MNDELTTLRDDEIETVTGERDEFAVRDSDADDMDTDADDTDAGDADADDL